MNICYPIDIPNYADKTNPEFCAGFITAAYIFGQPCPYDERDPLGCRSWVQTKIALYNATIENEARAAARSVLDTAEISLPRFRAFLFDSMAFDKTAPTTDDDGNALDPDRPWPEKVAFLRDRPDQMIKGESFDKLTQSQKLHYNTERLLRIPRIDGGEVQVTTRDKHYISELIHYDIVSGSPANIYYLRSIAKRNGRFGPGPLSQYRQTIYESMMKLSQDYPKHCLPKSLVNQAVFSGDIRSPGTLTIALIKTLAASASYLTTLPGLDLIIELLSTIKARPFLDQTITDDDLESYQGFSRNGLRGAVLSVKDTTDKNTEIEWRVISCDELEKEPEATRVRERRDYVYHFMIPSMLHDLIMLLQCEFRTFEVFPDGRRERFSEISDLLRSIVESEQGEFTESGQRPSESNTHYAARINEEKCEFYSNKRFSMHPHYGEIPTFRI